ncbi:hypothetical protein DRH27_02945 [Candidatus Falkowbacteria bacterium]|nr:MAG: hypothetical protein DRH27_02945 [Candidatus Falkowbacteria bacterium]
MPAIKGKLTAKKAILGFEGQLPVACGGRMTLKATDADVQLFKKDMISVGTYTHPIWEWKLDVTEERLYRWVASFEAMKANGVDVEVPVNHSFGAEDNLGYVVEMFVEPNADGVPTLYGIHEIRGESNIETVMANKNVSVAIEKDFVDGEGTHYGEAIIHSSVVQQPVVPGQEDFEKIAASANGGQEQVPVLTMSNVTKGQSMNEEMLKQIREMLGAGDDLTADNALSRVAEKITSLGEAKADVDKELLNITAELEKIKANGSKTASNIDPNLAEQMGVTAETQLTLLVAAGSISPACQVALQKAMVGEKTTRNLSMLALGENGKSSNFSLIFDALKLNKIADLTERTGLQTLSRTEPDEDNTENKPDEEMGEAMLASVGAEPKKK